MVKAWCTLALRVSLPCANSPQHGLAESDTFRCTGWTARTSDSNSELRSEKSKHGSKVKIEIIIKIWKITVGTPFCLPDEHSAVQVHPAPLVLHVKSAEQNDVVDGRRCSRGHGAWRPSVRCVVNLLGPRMRSNGSHIDRIVIRPGRKSRNRRGYRSRARHHSRRSLCFDLPPPSWPQSIPIMQILTSREGGSVEFRQVT